MQDRTCILLIERDEFEYRRLCAALRASGRPVHVHWAHDAADAQAYLAGLDGYADRVFFPLPECVLIDDTVPGKSMLELVRWIRTASPVPQARIVLFGGSATGEARVAAEEAGADVVLRKACDTDVLARDIAVALWIESAQVMKKDAYAA